MDIKITIGKKPFGRYKIKSERAFKDDEVVIVEFPNCEFKWLPTYKQLDLIHATLRHVEKLNKQEDKKNAESVEN